MQLTHPSALQVRLHGTGGASQRCVAKSSPHWYVYAGPLGVEDVPRITLVLAFWDESLVPAVGQPGSGPARIPPWRQHSDTESEKRAPGQQSNTADPADLSAVRSAHAIATLAAAQAVTDRGWLAADSQCTAASPVCLAPSSVQCVAVICPVWVAVIRTASAKRRRQQKNIGGNQCLSAPLPPLRFFLRSAEDIYRVYNYDRTHTD